MKYIKRTIIKNIFYSFVSLIFFATFTFGETAENKQQEFLKVCPSFSSAMDSPFFTVEFTNNETRTLDLTDLLKNESIILDGQEYPRRVVRFTGNPILKPNSQWKHTIGIDEFFPDSEKQKYSKKLERWRWKSSLKSGKHTLIVKFGGKESSIIEFIWDDSKPFLYE